MQSIENEKITNNRIVDRIKSGLFFLLISLLVSCNILQHSGNPHVIKRPMLQIESVGFDHQIDHWSEEMVISPLKRVKPADTAQMLLCDLESACRPFGSEQDTLDIMDSELMYSAMDSSLDTLYGSLTPEQKSIAVKAHNSYRISLTGGVVLALGVLIMLIGFEFGFLLVSMGAIIGLLAMIPGVKAYNYYRDNPDFIVNKNKAKIAVLGGILMALLWGFILGAVWFGFE